MSPFSYDILQTCITHMYTITIINSFIYIIFALVLPPTSIFQFEFHPSHLFLFVTFSLSLIHNFFGENFSCIHHFHKLKLHKNYARNTCNIM